MKRLTANEREDINLAADVFSRMTAEERVRVLRAYGRVRNRTGYAARFAEAVVRVVRANRDVVRASEGWPWCEACRSYHHPDNPTCFRRTRP